MRSDRISLSHGAGGTVMRDFIRDLFLRCFDNEYLRPLADAARFTLPSQQVVFTTDSYVVQPPVFNGGNVGKLAVCGTVNDLAVLGARPMYLSAGFILEEGLDLSLLEMIVQSMAETAREADVRIVTGDTKVVPHGECDGIFINTSGVGVYPVGHGLCQEAILPGDKVIVTGTVGDHGIAVLSGRAGLTFKSEVTSDCAALNGLIEHVLKHSSGVKWMRDPTRGGLAAALTEVTENRPFGLLLHEPAVPVRGDVRAVCELLGFDPLHLANEGKLALVVQSEAHEEIMELLQGHPLGTLSAVIGEISAESAGNVRVITVSGGIRRLRRPAGELLPRIC